MSPQTSAEIKNKQTKTNQTNNYCDSETYNNPKQLCSFLLSIWDLLWSVSVGQLPFEKLPSGDKKR